MGTAVLFAIVLLCMVLAASQLKNIADRENDPDGF
jgi:hypothetical protein